MNLRDKSKNLKDKLLQQDEDKKSKKSNKGDKRFLNYFDLKDGERMTIRLLPDGGESGEYWSEFDTHSIRAKGVDTIRCSYESNGEPCDVCNHSYNYYLEGDKTNNGKWRAHTKFIAQCLVIDAPFEVNGHDDEDENPVKLFAMPYGVYELIKEAVIEDRVGDIMDTDFIIKNVKKQGKGDKDGYNNYDKSYFAKDEEPLGDEILDAFESGDLKLFDFAEIVPDATISEDMEEWLDKAIAVDAKASRTSTSSRQSNSDDEESVKESDSVNDAPAKKSSASSLLHRLQTKKDNNKDQ